jgi:hypothetical protein
MQCDLGCSSHNIFPRIARYGANVLCALQSLWKRIKCGTVLKVKPDRRQSSTIKSALQEGGAITANLGPSTLHIVQIRDSTESFLEHIEPLCCWEYLVELFKTKYKPSTPKAHGRGKVHHKERLPAHGKAHGETAVERGAEAELDVVLTRGRAEIAATMFAEITAALRSVISTETQLSSYVIENMELLLFTCKAIPAAAFDALKHFLSISVPRRSLAHVLNLLSVAKLDFPIDDLASVWTEELLSSIDTVVEDEPLPRQVAEMVYDLAYMGAVGGEKASSKPMRRKSVERIW